MRCFLFLLLFTLLYSSFVFAEEDDKVFSRPEPHPVSVDFNVMDYNFEDELIVVDIIITAERNLSYLKITIETDGISIEENTNIEKNAGVIKEVYAGETLKFRMPIFLQNEEFNRININTLSIDTTRKLKELTFRFNISPSKMGISPRSEVIPSHW